MPPTYYTNSSLYVAPNQQASKALDAADGVIDGRYYGTPIATQAPYYASTPVASAAPTYVGTLAPASAYGRAPMTTYGPTSYGGAVVAGNQQQALSHDAADGVIDGKYHGNQVFSAAPTRALVPSYGTTYGATSYGPYGGAVLATNQQHALAVDAADGVIDGKYYGNQVYSAAPQLAPVTSYGPTYAPTSSSAFGGAVVASSQQHALAVDAADGVIDGRYFGKDVYNAGPSANRHPNFGPVDPRNYDGTIVSVEYIEREQGWKPPTAQVYH